ncbi:MAG: hypothetical protein LBU73_03125 [Helicobacteraceae bacterium]|jgi:hypothetical protein|nr:hypothetical protein [Helicobacteraceae bacterium]
MGLYGTTGPNGETLSYEVFYNHTASIDDFLETFKALQYLDLNGVEQELSESYELFDAIRNGEGPFYEQIAPFIAVAANKIEMEFTKALINVFEYFDNSPTAADLAEHRSKINRLFAANNKLLFVAHSQGNLFAAFAYDYAVGLKSEKWVKVVHIAPVMPVNQLKGPYVLASSDRVVLLLDIVTFDTPNPTDVVPIYFNPLTLTFRPPGANGNRDPFLSHGFAEIYINPNFTTAQKIRQYMNEAIKAMAESLFTFELNWSGMDWRFAVEMLITEPSGNQIDFMNNMSSVGYYDANRISPDYYIASCSAANLIEGIYEFRLTRAYYGSGYNDASIGSAEVTTYKSDSLEIKYFDFANYSPSHTIKIVVAKEANGDYAISWQ